MVIQFDFRGEVTGSYWLLLEPGEPSVCWDPPGFEVDLIVRCDTLAMHRVWLGHQSLADALAKGQIELDGARGVRQGVSGLVCPQPLRIGQRNVFGGRGKERLTRRATRVAPLERPGPAAKSPPNT